MNAPLAHRGFTLIEALIAITLGLAICSVASMAVSAALRATVVANQLSLENGLMREGVAATLDDLDTWRSLDDPDVPARQTLRSTPGWPAPFAPLDLGGIPIDTDASSPRSWFRGDPIHGDSTDLGDFSILSGIGDADADHRWHHQLISRLTDQLGYYALIDYVPADTIYSWIGPDGHAVPEFWDCRSTAAGEFSNANFGSWNLKPRDLVGVTRGTFYLVTTDPWYLTAGVHRRYFPWWNNTGTPAGFSRADAFTHGAQNLSPLPLHPGHWPSVQALTRRFIVGYRRWQTGTVVIASPVTGQQLKLFVATTSTTLRGARRQRDAAAGWARAGQPTLDQ